MKTQTLAKTMVVAALFTGALCWSAAADDTTQLWRMNCASCHGKDGTGQTMMGRRLQMKDLTDLKVQASFTDAEATKTIKEGVTDNGTVKMKAVGDKFSDDQIKELVAQVRSFKPAK
ncbi:MAG: c-type cytochrome [Verrucomicrobiota bacterium]